MIYFLLFCVLSMAAMAESAISNSSVQATTTSGGATTLDWVKITAVPLGVFLLGACIWGIVVDITARWNRSFNARGEPHEAHEVSAHGQVVNNGFNARDLEEGLELSHRGTEDDLAMAPNPPVVPDRMQPELESAHNTQT